MAAAEDSTRSGLSRRDALRLLAATSTTVAAGSMIISQPAHADSGSSPCRYEFGGTPQVTVRIINQSGNRTDFLSVAVSGVGGDCACGPRIAPIEYSYWITIPDTGQNGTGWTTSSAASVGSPSKLWENSGGEVTVAVGIRVTCPAKVGTAVRCRFGSATFTVAGPNSNTTQSFPLGSNNGGSAPPAGLPACDGALLRSAPLLRSSSASGGLNVVAGAGTPPLYDPTADEPATDLGAPATDETTTTTAEPAKASDSTSTTDSTTTTTTSPPDTSSTTTTSTTPGTTSTSSSTSTTAAPPEG